MSLLPTVLVEVELAGVGGGWTNIASDVLRGSSILIRSGITGGGPQDRVASTASASFKLNNSTRNSGGLLGYYSPFHASKRSGWGLGIKCRIRLTDPNTSTTRTRIVGRIDQIVPAAGQKGQRSVDVVVVGWMDEAARWALTPEIGEQVGKSWDQILTAILAQMPRQPESTSFDVGVEAYPYALVTSEQTKQTALGEFAKLAASEFGLIYVKGDGTLRAEGRHQRLLDTTSDWTITDADESGLVLPSTRDQIINTVRVQEHPQIVDPLPTTLVYDQANAIAVNAGDTKQLLGPFRDPVTGEPIGATDVNTAATFTANSMEDGTGTDLTASFTVTVTIGPSGARFDVTNSSGTNGFLTSLSLYGRGIYDRGTVQFEATDATSIAAFGEHAVNFDMPYQADDDVGQGAADYILARYKDSAALVRTVTVFGRSTAALAQILARDISDRLTLSETVTGASAVSYFINGIDFTVRPSGHVTATYTLAPAADPFSGLYWILGTSTLGTDTVLAPF